MTEYGIGDEGSTVLRDIGPDDVKDSSFCGNYNTSFVYDDILPDVDCSESMMHTRNS
jgi:hypothetical protein